MDTIKGLALIATFIGFLAVFAMWVSLWENVWQPTGLDDFMHRLMLRRLTVITLLTFALWSPASAHCIVGSRFFPATLIVDDPCVNDELALPTIAAFKNGDEPSADELDISGEYSKTITELRGFR